mmetsp:Transcript_40417/g.72290  ORF Transcript_40417/g.72290 Transcript_40417/m.72290 type:complete len:227 (+) Transcript_40417:1494-2174(+)
MYSLQLWALPRRSKFSRSFNRRKASAFSSSVLPFFSGGFFSSSWTVSAKTLVNCSMRSSAVCLNSICFSSRPASVSSSTDVPPSDSQSTKAFNSARWERPALRARQEGLRCDWSGAVGFRRIWFLMRTIELTPEMTVEVSKDSFSSCWPWCSRMASTWPHSDSVFCTPSHCCCSNTGDDLDLTCLLDAEEGCNEPTDVTIDGRLDATLDGRLDATVDGRRDTAVEC